MKYLGEILKESGYSTFGIMLVTQSVTKWLKQKEQQYEEESKYCSRDIIRELLYELTNEAKEATTK